jgi:magnesium transporter
MLRLFGPNCDGSPIEVTPTTHIPADVVWLDLLEPTREEESLAEKFIGSNVPTRADLQEIEPSSRLYQRGDTLYMTMSTLVGIDEGAPTTTPIAFLLTEHQLVTVRYGNPRPFKLLAENFKREPGMALDASHMFIRLLDAIVDRLADEIERAHGESEKLSRHIFAKEMDERRIPAKRLTALLTRIGRAQSLLSRIRETAVSTSRLLHFLSATQRVRSLEDERDHVGSLIADVAALIDHSSFMSEQLTFQLAGADLDRAECGDEAVQLGRSGVHAADAGGGYLRHELRPYARAQMVLRLSDGAWHHAAERGRPVVLYEAPRLALGRI